MQYVINKYWHIGCNRYSSDNLFKCVLNFQLQLLPSDGSSCALCITHIRLGFDIKDHLLECSILRFEMLVKTTFSFLVLLLWNSFSFAGETPK